jgi:cytochrome c oxidase subunit 3
MNKAITLSEIDNKAKEGIKNFQAHPFHLVETSPWPFINSFSLLTLTTGAVMSFNNFSYGIIVLSIGFITTAVTMALWFRDVIAESSYQGHHTFEVGKGISLGVGLFIASEVMFFLSIFWAFFHSSLAPTVELGSAWPPLGIQPINPFELPLLNTVLLLSSGATVTYAHHSLIGGNRKGTIYGLIITLILAVLFTSIQGFEYYGAPFTFADSVFGSCFFMSTGFHGIHVLVGSIFIAVGLWRVISYQLTDHHHIGLESAILYWHFVDVVWLFLFIAVYWWGS